MEFNSCKERLNEIKKTPPEKFKKYHIDVFKEDTQRIINRIWSGDVTSFLMEYIADNYRNISCDSHVSQNCQYTR